MGIYSLSEFNGIDFGGGGAKIKSVQRGSISPTSGSVHYDTISEVDLSKSILRFNVMWDSSTGDLTDSSVYLIRGEFSNSTTLKFARDNDNGRDPDVEWEVIEFDGDVSVQSGVSNFLMYPASNIIDISTINPEKSLVFYSYSSTFRDGFLSHIAQSLTILDEDRLVMRRGDGLNSDNTQVSWYVVEFLN